MPQIYRVIVSLRAFADLDLILDYVKLGSPQNAAKLIDRLWQAAHSLKQLPHRYPMVIGRRKPKTAVRRMVVPPYLIYYRIIEEHHVVRILAVIHGSRRQPRRFEP